MVRLHIPEAIVRALRAAGEVARRPRLLQRHRTTQYNGFDVNQLHSDHLDQLHGPATAARCRRRCHWPRLSEVAHNTSAKEASKASRVRGGVAFSRDHLV